MPVYLQYYFWLISASLLLFFIGEDSSLAEKATGFAQGYWAGFVLASLQRALFWTIAGSGHRKPDSPDQHVFTPEGWPVPQDIALLSDSPLWLQFIVFLLLKDFLEWNVHRLLHNVPWLWEFHKLHHSIEELDWIGNFRFHWGEILLYKAFTYLPLVILGIDEIVLLLIAVVWTVLLDLNHSNFRFSWGPLRYVLNSSAMHVWHHDKSNSMGKAARILARSSVSGTGCLELFTGRKEKRSAPTTGIRGYEQVPQKCSETPHLSLLETLNFGLTD